MRNDECGSESGGDALLIQPASFIVRRFGVMDEKLNQLREQFFADVKAITSADALNALRDKYLGRKAGLIAAEKKRVGGLSPEDRAAFGQQVNQLSNEVEAEMTKLSEAFAAAAEAGALEREKIDV